MRRRILVATLVVTTAALVVFGVPLGWSLGHMYRSQQLTRLRQAATSAAAAVPAEGLHGRDPIEPPPVPAGTNLAYYDTGGQLVAGHGPGTPDSRIQRAAVGTPAEGSVGTRLVVAVPIFNNETPIGAVEATSARSAVTSRTLRTWLAMLVLGLAALVIATLTAVWQGRRLTAPVDHLVDAAGRLAEGDFAGPVGMSGVAELDRAAVALEATSARIRELLDRERAFTAHASHQLRTPLTALRLSLENALETPGVDPRVAAGDAVAEVDRLQHTLDELLALARTGGLPDRRMPVADILTNLEQRWHPVLADRGRRLELDDRALRREQTGPVTLGQILDILVDNATTHGRGTVEVTAVSAAGGVTVEVIDEGDGVQAIPDSAAGNGASHGLGLPLARQLAGAAGGRLVLKRFGPRPAIAVFLP